MTNSMLFEGKDVEILVLNGNVLFNANHVGQVMGIKDIKSSIRNFNKNQRILVTNSDVHEMHFRKLNNAGELFLTESGVYKISFRSHKPEAERFTDWVADEVLPSIRKTGQYSVQEKPDSYMIEDRVERAQRWIEEQQEKRLIQENNKLLNEKIESDRPLVAFAGTVLKSSDNILVRELAKVMSDQGISMGEKRLYKWLRQQKMIMKSSTEPYQSAIDKGLFVREEKTVSIAYGEKLVFTTKVTPKGQVCIIEKYKELYVA